MPAPRSAAHWPSATPLLTQHGNLLAAHLTRPLEVVVGSLNTIVLQLAEQSKWTPCRGARRIVTSWFG
jgi:hypothetical protein